jgi:hypothetical protein
MSKKELILAELDKLSEESLDKLYAVARALVRRDDRTRSGGNLMDELLSIQIDGPDDFAANLDHYLYGHPKSDDVR